MNRCTNSIHVSSLFLHLNKSISIVLLCKHEKISILVPLRYNSIWYIIDNKCHVSCTIRSQIQETLKLCHAYCVYLFFAVKMLKKGIVQPFLRKCSMNLFAQLYHQWLVFLFYVIKPFKHLSYKMWDRKMYFWIIV